MRLVACHRYVAKDRGDGAVFRGDRRFLAGEGTEFIKCHGLGNDFVLVEDLDGTAAKDPDLVRSVCHRRFGVGADGVLYLGRSERADFAMRVMNADGSSPTRLTRNNAADYSPAWSPDGERLAFVSDRDGQNEIYVMNADGSHQTQMTFDQDLNSWFAHISPNGKLIVYIAYHKGDVEPGQHVADKNVVLRLMPAKGGTPKTILQLFGGQGTLNVNSWAPDSKRFAFVSYRYEK